MRKGWKSMVPVSNWPGLLLAAALATAACSLPGLFVPKVTPGVTQTSTLAPNALTNTATPTFFVPITGDQPTGTPEAKKAPTATQSVSVIPDTPVPAESTPTNPPENVITQGEAPAGLDDGQLSVTQEDVIAEMLLPITGGGSCIMPDYDPESGTYPVYSLMEAYPICTFDWQPGEQVTVTAINPMGNADSRVFTAEDITRVSTWYQPQAGDVPGLYQFLVHNAIRKIQTTAIFQPPDGPRVYLVSGDRFNPVFNTQQNNYQLQFSGFQPGETVHLGIYQVEQFYGMNMYGEDSSVLRNSEAKGWKDIRMDANGSLTIAAIESGVAAYLAYGEQSGEAHMLTLNIETGKFADWFGAGRDYVCPGALPSRMRRVLGSVLPVSSLVASNPSEDFVMLREKPGEDGLPILRIGNGKVMKILEGPKCVQGMFWWKAAEPFDGSIPPPETITGWVPETIQGQYVLEQVK